MYFQGFFHDAASWNLRKWEIFSAVISTLLGPK